jgi:murein L,D-transpeptidase YcbB/YkuD
MNKRWFALLACFLLAATSTTAPHWTTAQIDRLIARISAAGDEGLAPAAEDIAAIHEAAARADATALDRAATMAAVSLLTAYRDGCCNASLRTGWHIMDDVAWPDAGQAVADAVSSDRLDQLFAGARPTHPFFTALQQAYAKESDPARRATLAANLDRWRWMPRGLGSRYLLVNTAAFEATLWQEGKLVGRWAVVVGKTNSPTPVFRALVTGVTFNPWWEIPNSIAAEGIASMVAKRPAEAARKGYVLQYGRYRQKPGPSNALGRMKLVMPNGYNVYLHDTPSQSLFAQDIRAYSHGCVRVGDALGLASTLLSSQDGWDRARVDAQVSTGQTLTVPLAQPIPVYIVYFTAEPAESGVIRYFPDVYRRDRGASAPTPDGKCGGVLAHLPG